MLSESAVEVISGLVTKTGGSANTTCLLGEPILLLLVLLDKYLGLNANGEGQPPEVEDAEVEE